MPTSGEAIKNNLCGPKPINRPAQFLHRRKEAYLWDVFHIVANAASFRGEEAKILVIDKATKERALRRYGPAASLHVPIGAVDEAAITSYIGEIVAVLSGRGMRRAFLVRAGEPPERDLRFPIWGEPGYEILFQQLQVWVDITYHRYRPACRKAFPNEDVRDKVLSHAINRRMAALQGFRFVRLTPTSRAANSSSAFVEGWGVALHSTKEQIEANRKSGVFIQYADLTALMLLLDMRLGGGVMEAVNEAQKLIRPRLTLSIDDVAS